MVAERTIFAAFLVMSLSLVVAKAVAQLPGEQDGEGKSPARTEWEKQVGPEMRSQPAFQFVEEDPSLPRVLIVGDSISIGYTAPVRDLLKGRANVLRIPANGGPTSKGIASLSEWLGSGKWDVIHFNWGLHDIKRMKDGKVDVAGEWQVSPEQYETNLDQLVRALMATGAKLIWASTTPVPDGAAGRIKGDEVRVNAIAGKVMKKYNVPINDLYAYVLPHLAEYQMPRNVHFTADGYGFLAKQVAAKISKALNTTSKGPST